ncbi:hypothetical protein [Roseibacillus ishigakijimensis]|uniref:Uncharacterized protein n=1 Tax=Roseibacillus ishigakijimensis TaxID=454146 RepID=A0A934RLY2_9BACT|nr:hypothetical protein [Roseibacillus ishigakijimensis]MBK1833819.1 hypothetical protein [Roseibacillus ishigakijimensis]
MSESSSDKKSYSVDEMMEALRDGEREKSREGELVTREDGTQVLRVKKRKRRSKQKKDEIAKKKKRLNIVKTVAAIAIPLVVGLAILLITMRYHAPSFLQGITASVWERTGAHGDLRRLSPLGTRVGASVARLSWPDGHTLETLALSELEGDLNLWSFLTGDLKGQELNANKGFLVVSSRDNRKINPPKGEPIALSGFDRYTSDSFSFFFGRPQSPFRLQDTRVKFVSSDYSQQLILGGGELRAGSWGEVPFKRGTLEFFKDHLKVVSLRFEEPERHLILTGNVHWKDSDHELAVQVVRGTLGNLAGFGLGSLLDSQVANTEGTLRFRSWDPASHLFKVSFAPDLLTLRNLPLQKILSEVYGDPDLEEFEFRPSGEISILRRADGCEISGLDFQDVGRFAFRGSVSVTGGQLGGKLEIGLPDHREINLSRDASQALFAQGRLADGYFWFEVNLSGTVSEPEDDFGQFLGQGATGQSADDLFDQLTR